MSKRYLIVAAILVIAGLGLVASGFTADNKKTDTTKNGEVDTSASAKKDTSSATTDNSQSVSDEQGSVASATDNSAHTGVAAPRMANNVAATTPAQTATTDGTSAGTGTTSTSTGGETTPTTPTVVTAVTISTPASGATIAGTVSVSANATASEAIAFVQFKMDGLNTVKVTAAPYAYAFNTATAANGSHSLSATVQTTSGVTAEATAVTVTINNVVVTPPATGNLVTNPSVEDAADGQPTGWSQGGFGNNTSTFRYEATGHTGSRSLSVTTSAYTDGDAKWGSVAFPVTAGKTYQVSNFYKSNVATQVDVEFTVASQTGTTFQLVGTAAASTDWANFKGQFTAPVGATSVVIYHILQGIGTLTTDDYSVEAYTPTSFNRALVSLTFDDGWKNIYTYGAPLLAQYNMKSTQYLNSQPIQEAYPDYMTPADVQALIAAGHEIASHTATHADLTTLTVDQIDQELTTCNAYLAAITNNQASLNFASPFGNYNTTTLTEIQKYNTSHRSVESGYNSKDNFNVFNIKVQNIVANTTTAQVEAWVNEAIATKTWLVLVYHDVTPTLPPDAVGLAPADQYWTTPADLQTELSHIASTGVTVSTIKDALAELQPQL